MNRTESLEFADLALANAPMIGFCEHLTPDAERYHTCVHHPECGMTCGPCQVVHELVWHDSTRPCDRCGSADGLRSAPAFTWIAVDGRPVLLALFGGILCPPCLAAVQADPRA